MREDVWERVVNSLEGAQSSVAGAETGGPLRQHDGRGEDESLDFQIFRSRLLSQPPNGHERSAEQRGPSASYRATGIHLLLNHRNPVANSAAVY